jgi:hypothetical protein
MLRLKFPVTMTTRGHIKIAKNHYFALIFSIKIDFSPFETTKRGVKKALKGVYVG